jgi:taurine dioxygenase
VNAASDIELTNASGAGSEVRLEPLSPHVGATVRSQMTLSGRPSEAVLGIVREALAQHLVLVVEDQRLSPADLRDLASHFGEPHVHHDDEGVIRADDVPEVLEMRKEPDGTRLFGGASWHADVTFAKPAGLISILHALIIPPVGGDTMFASTIAAFAALSPAMQDLLRTLEAVHSYDGPGAPDREGLTAVHPVVRRHPDTGEEGIYLNRMFVVRFVGMTADESRPMIDFLDRHMTRPEFTCRVRWSEGQVVMWDNRFTLHYPIDDIVGHRRLLLRCTALE